MRPLAPITVPVPAAVPHAVPVALPTTVPDHIPANGTTAALGSANGGGNAKPVFSPAVTPPFDRPHGLAHGSGMEPARLPDEASLRLFVATWNMHGKAPPASLVPWLPASPDEHDMYVIGTQEAERSIEKSLIISSKAKWEAALRAHFGDGFVLLSVCPSRPSPASTSPPCPGSTSPASQYHTSHSHGIPISHGIPSWAGTLAALGHAPSTLMLRRSVPLWRRRLTRWRPSTS